MPQAVLSNYLIDKLLGNTFTNTAFTPPTTWFIALFTTEPLPAASGTEVSGGSYARQAVAYGSVTSHQVKNSGTISFPTATGTWGAIAWVAIFDAVTSGNMLVYAPLSATITVSSGNTFPPFAANALVHSFL